MSSSPTPSTWGVRGGGLLLLAIASFALFTSLDDRLLWGDEAETALLAQNVMRFGVPRSDDGHNRVAHLGVRDSNDAGIWIWSPWLDEYVAAASFAVAGPSAFSARFPFALAGLLSVALIGWLAQRSYRDPELALTAMALLATCVPFLLHARQSRYYALAMLAMLWLLFGFQQWVERNRRGSFHIAGALSVLFYSNYVILPGALFGLVAAVAWLRRSTPQLSAPLAAAVGAFLVLALPWLLYADFGTQASALSTQYVFMNLIYYLSELHFHVIPWVVLALPLFGVMLRRFGKRATGAGSTDARAGREIEVLIGCIAVLHLAMLAVSPFRFFRYLTPLIPLLLLLAAATLHRELRNDWLRRAVVLILIASNGIAVVSFLPTRQHSLGSEPARFANSLLHDYSDRLEVVARYLREEADPEQSVAVADPEFPLAFHTGMRVLDTRRRGAWPPSPPYPDWILSVSPSGVSARDPLQLPPAIRSAYREIEVEVPRSRRGGGRPDPHLYEWLRSEETEPLRLYRLR